MQQTVQLQGPDVPSQDQRDDAVRQKILAGSGDKAVDAQWKLALRAAQGEAIDGSPAIAYGRAIGLAMEKQQPDVAQFFREKLVIKDAHFDSTIAQLYDAYGKTPEKFAAFVAGKNGFTSGTAFSNALGSYAYAFDYLERGDAALAGGEKDSVLHWGAEAMRAGSISERAEAAPRGKMALPAQNAEDVKTQKQSSQGMIRVVSASMSAAAGAFFMYWVGRFGDSTKAGRVLGSKTLPWLGGVFGFLISIYATRPGEDKRMDDSVYMDRHMESQRFKPEGPQLQDARVETTSITHQGKMQAEMAPQIGM